MGEQVINRLLPLLDEITQTLSAVESLRKDDRYGLGVKMQRAAGTIISDVGSGFRKPSGQEKSLLFERAFSALRELHYQIGLAYRLGYVNEERHTACDRMADEARKLLAGQIASLRLKQFNQTSGEDTGRGILSESLGFVSRT